MPTGVYQRTSWHRDILCENLQKAREFHLQFNTEWRRRISEVKKGVVFTEEHRRRISESKKCNPVRYWLGKKRLVSTKWLEHLHKLGEKQRGSNHPRWVQDRQKYHLNHDRTNAEYRVFLRNVLRRDNRCMMQGQECSGKLEVHHIKSWIGHPELRYDVNNGIVLCHFHHPRSKAENVEMEANLLNLIAKP